MSFIPEWVSFQNEVHTAFTWQNRPSQPKVHGKKSGVFRFRKRAANLHKTGHLRAFSVVHQPENPRFSKCFRVGEFAVFIPLSGSFPVLQTPENMRFLAFTGRLTLGKRLVNQHSLKFSHWKTWCSPQFTSEILHFPYNSLNVSTSLNDQTDQADQNSWNEEMDPV